MDAEQLAERFYHQALSVMPHIGECSRSGWSLGRVRWSVGSQVQLRPTFAAAVLLMSSDLLRCSAESDLSLSKRDEQTNGQDVDQ